MFKIENNISIELLNFLRVNEIIDTDEKVIAIEKPGEGNMNLVLRVITDKQAVILKQSRDFVNKYPQIEAPIERIFVEAAFYKTISPYEIIKEKMPNLLGFYPDQYLIVLEDLGPNTDYSAIYSKNSPLAEIEIKELVNYLNNLHSISVLDYPQNAALKKLNHFHIFNFPFQQENGFDLEAIQEGLQRISIKYKTDELLKTKIKHLGEIYLQTGTTLLHGDYYPGSWLKTDKGLKIIDPEFGYLGMPEFDLGVFLAHLLLASKSEFVIAVFENYKNKIDQPLVYAFAGIEIMRRLIGIAQLPLSLPLKEKEELLKQAKLFIENYEN